MTVYKRSSLRKHIDDHCKVCIHDKNAAGTWRQQVTLCSVSGCALFAVRPATKAPIPESVLDYYDVPEVERAVYRRARHQESCFSDYNHADRCRSKGTQ